MEPILSKHEIDDLLKAIREGRVSLDLDGTTKQTNFKESTPLNLFQVTSYSDDISRLPNFDIILDNFGQQFSITLTNQLQRTFLISRTGMESAHFNDFLLDNKETGAIGVLDLNPLKHGALLFIDSHMCYSMIEIMLGASTEIDPLEIDRKLTSIELSIMKSILTKGCDDLNRAFSQLVEMTCSLHKVESNSRLVSITEPDAEILVGTYSITVGEVTGNMRIVFPQTTLDPLRDGLKDLLNVNKAKQTLWTDIIKDQIHSTQMELIALSGIIDMSVDQVLSLHPGDIIPLNYNPNLPLEILIENTPKFHAVPGTHNGKKAISISGISNLGE